nr:MAG TPA: hypothetical protein [Caudoviricetes sp.]
MNSRKSGLPSKLSENHDAYPLERVAANTEHISSRRSAPATITQSRLRTVIRQYQAMRVVLAVAVTPMMD